MECLLYIKFRSGGIDKFLSRKSLPRYLGNSLAVAVCQGVFTVRQLFYYYVAELFARYFFVMWQMLRYVRDALSYRCESL